MKNFISLVKERPDQLLTLNNVSCPYCNGVNIDSINHCQTLVATIGDNDDGNHHWHSYECLDCQRKFTVEKKGINIWYVDEKHKVLKGIPTCFEEYIYTCSFCGGEVNRHYRNLNDDGTVELLSEEIGGENHGRKNYRVFFECDQCKQRRESDTEYYTDEKEYTEREERFKKEGPRKLRAGWKIEEQIDEGFVYCPYIPIQNDEKV